MTKFFKMSTNIHSQGKVPFSWEDKPGIRKANSENCPPYVGHVSLKLPLPPCLPETPRPSFKDFQIPLPPSGAFLTPSRSCSRRGLKKQDDPFVLAYKECTKRSRSKKKSLNVFSCKHSCSVRDDGIISMSQLPISKNHTEST